MSVAATQERENPGQKILASARELFYERGYGGVGINEIIERSGTSKKSFYNYYESKQELGAACLAAEEQDLFKFMRYLAERYPTNFRAFSRAWALSLKKASAQPTFHGCPFWNLAAHSGQEFGDQVRQIMRLWRHQLQSYLRQCEPKLSKNQAARLADVILVHYQGAVQMWRLSRDTTFFEVFAQLLDGLLGKR